MRRRRGGAGGGGLTDPEGLGGAGGAFRDATGRKWVTLPNGTAIPWENSIFAKREREAGRAGGRRTSPAGGEADTPQRRIKPEADGILTNMLRGR